LKKTGDVSTTTIRRVGVAIDCADAGPVTRFYERLLGFEMGDFEPPHLAQLWKPAPGVHINISLNRTTRRKAWLARLLPPVRRKIERDYRALADRRAELSAKVSDVEPTTVRPGFVRLPTDGR